MTALTATTRPSTARVAAGLGLAAVAAVALNALVALVARAAGADPDFQPLHFATFTAFTVAGVLAGAAGWAVVRRRARRPAAVLRILVPAVVLVSLIPDLAVLLGDSMPGVNATGVLGLMVMHVVVAAVAVPALQRILPVRES